MEQVVATQSVILAPHIDTNVDSVDIIPELFKTQDLVFVTDNQKSKLLPLLSCLYVHSLRLAGIERINAKHHTACLELVNGTHCQ